MTKREAMREVLQAASVALRDLSENGGHDLYMNVSEAEAERRADMVRGLARGLERRSIRYTLAGVRRARARTAGQ